MIRVWALAIARFCIIEATVSAHVLLFALYSFKAGNTG